MPRGRVRFDTDSPKDPDWPKDPEKAVRRIMSANKAEYVEKSLSFTHNAKSASALFVTREPKDGDCGTDYYALARDLDASEVTLYLSPELWLERKAQGEEG